MPVRRMLAVTCVVPLLLVAACQADEPEPKMPTPSPSASSTSPPTTTPTVDPLAIPAEAKEPTKAGAEVLVRHYFDMFNYFLESGDAGPVRELYGKRCSFCEVPVQVFELARAKGHTYEGSEDVRRMDVSLLGKAGGIQAAIALVTTDQKAIVERDEAGGLVSRIPPNPSQRYKYFLAFQGGKWEITNAEDTP